jgi:hypothetical protein
MMIQGRVLRVFDDAGDAGRVTYIAIGNPVDQPPYTGAVSLGAGLPTISQAFAAFKIDADAAARFPYGASVTLTINPPSS